MSCNGCRVLRKGCGEKCVLRSSLCGIDSPEAQGNATLFLAKFFGRSDLLSFISSVAEPQRPALFRSLLYEACGRTVNPVNGAVGLLSSGNWHICEAAVETVLSGGSLRPIQNGLTGVGRSSRFDESADRLSGSACSIQSLYSSQSRAVNLAASTGSDPSMLLSLNFGRGSGGVAAFFSTADQSEVTNFEGGQNGGPAKKLLNLFV